jgi:Flp pilus assembly protein TadB
MNEMKKENWYCKFCRASARFFRSKPGQSKRIEISMDGKESDPEAQLKKDLNFARLALHPSEVKAGAAGMAVLSIIFISLLSILLVFPFFQIQIELDGRTYNSIDRNGDGISDIVQDRTAVEEADYNEFGIETTRQVIGYQCETSFFKIFLYVLLPVLIIPYAAALLMLSYPSARAKRYRLKTLASVPQTVNYLTMSLRLNPSLETSVQFAGENVKGPMGESLGKLLWDVYLRTCNTIEVALMKFADEWGTWNESFKRALYLLRASVLEKTSEGRRQVLDKANSVILTGVKLEINQFANGLKGPSMFMFAFGIILPIIIATMLPITGVGMDSIGLVILMMDVILPVICFIYARRILNSRPVLKLGTKTEQKQFEAAEQNKNLNLTCAAVILITLLFTGAAVMYNYFPGIEPRYGALMVILGFAFPAAFFLHLNVRKEFIRLKKLRKLDDEFPDALFQLGSRISEGLPLERALDDTARVLKGTAIAEVFFGIVHSSRITRKSIHTLFAKGQIPGVTVTGNIMATMKVVVEAVEKNSSGAGEIIIDISNYLRDLRTMDTVLKHKMGEVLGTIKQTGTIFAPVIIGLTTAMYFMLNANLSGLDLTGGMNGMGFGGFGTTDPIPGELFVLIFGVYLLLTVSVITYFVSGMETPDDSVQFKKSLSSAIMSSACIFVMASALGFHIFGA